MHQLVDPLSEGEGCSGDEHDDRCDQCPEVRVAAVTERVLAVGRSGTSKLGGRSNNWLPTSASACVASAEIAAEPVRIAAMSLATQTPAPRATATGARTLVGDRRLLAGARPTCRGMVWSTKDFQAVCITVGIGRGCSLCLPRFRIGGRRRLGCRVVFRPRGRCNGRCQFGREVRPTPSSGERRRAHQATIRV